VSASTTKTCSRPRPSPQTTTQLPRLVLNIQAVKSSTLLRCILVLGDLGSCLSSRQVRTVGCRNGAGRFSKLFVASNQTNTQLFNFQLAPTHFRSSIMKIIFTTFLLAALPILGFAQTCGVWDLQQYGDGLTGLSTCNNIPEAATRTTIVADGACQRSTNTRVGYYRASCTDGGGLIFDKVHCDEGCTNCDQLGDNDSFILTDDENISGVCYFLGLNAVTPDTDVHRFTGTCNATCAPNSAASTPTVALLVSFWSVVSLAMAWWF
jgi:hypothetical protein